jgi:NAD(P)-dependent dehydrogenase (short-subunit alcohol dehydrogenase family)
MGAIEAQLGPVDILVNNAGVSDPTPLWDLDLVQFQRVLDVNLLGGFLCLKAVAPGMRDRNAGRIIWISSLAGKQGGGFFGTAAYAASKAGVIGLCQAVARELGPFGITSNAIAPGYIHGTTLVGDRAAELDERVRSVAPLRRSGTVEDVAAAVVFLASDSAGYITGEVMDVNGGVYFD